MSHPHCSGRACVVMALGSMRWPASDDCASSSSSEKTCSSIESRSDSYIVIASSTSSGSSSNSPSVSSGDTCSNPLVVVSAVRSLSCALAMRPVRKPCGTVESGRMLLLSPIVIAVEWKPCALERPGSTSSLYQSTKARLFKLHSPVAVLALSRVMVSNSRSANSRLQRANGASRPWLRSIIHGTLAFKPMAKSMPVCSSDTVRRSNALCTAASHMLLSTPRCA
eukprot:4107561-Prymnesium_polylepis.2